MKDSMHFEIEINAPAQEVWDTMLEQDTYRQWTTAFGPSSYYEGSWEKGASIKFLGDGGYGMSAEIAENEPYKFISIRHLSEIKDGVETAWPEPGYENYTFKETNGVTHLQIELELNADPEMTEMFEDMWPKALLKLKSLCE